jgi:hypothetical protein
LPAPSAQLLNAIRLTMKRALFTVAFAATLGGILYGLVLLVRHGRVSEERERTPLGREGYPVRSVVQQSGVSPTAVVTDREGRPLSSWRFFNAAFLLGDPVQTGYYGQHAHVDKPWNSPENKRYLSGPYREYMGSPLSYIDATRPGNKARFVAVQGPGTAFDHAKRVAISDLPGGLILVVETKGCQRHWMEPGEATLTFGRCRNKWAPKEESARHRKRTTSFLSDARIQACGSCDPMYLFENWQSSLPSRTQIATTATAFLAALLSVSGNDGQR